MKKTSTDYIQTYYGQQLLKKHSLNESGIWQVYGEDGNDSPFSCGNMPYIGTFEGVLADIIEYATSLDKFWVYGSGGKIEKITIKKITASTYLRRQELNTRIAQLKREADSLEIELNHL